MHRRTRLLLSLWLPLSVLLSACHGDTDHAKDPRTQPPLVRDTTVQSSMTPVREFTGTVAARTQSDLGFRVPGKIIERRVDTGQVVKQGQVLMKLDAQDLELQTRAAQNNMQAARAKAKQTLADEKRYHILMEKGVISASAYDQIKAASDAAQAEVSAAIAQARVATNASLYSVLKADSDGVIIETLADPGQVVSAGQTVIRLAKSGPREAVINLPETLRPMVGQAVETTLFGKSNSTTMAVLRQLSDSADPITRTYEARFTLSGPAATAPLGATITVRIPLSKEISIPSTALIPISALSDTGTATGVWVIKMIDHKVTWRQIRIVSMSDDMATVEGLHEGERIVALGAHLLHDGDTVRLASFSSQGDQS